MELWQFYKQVWEAVGLQLHDGAVQWLRGWALALRDKDIKQKAVEKARRVKYCQDL